MTECGLLGSFSFFVQFILFVMSFSSLLVKRQLEHPKRSVRVWLMDTSKQAFASGSEHFINLFLAQLFGGDSEGDPCVWFFVAGFVGFSFGTPFAFVMIRIFTFLARRFKIKPLENTGVYNEDLLGTPKISWWAAQCSMWLFIIAIQRTCMGLMFSVSWIHTALGNFGLMVMWPVEGTFYVRIVVVIIVLPVLINMGEFWVQDNFLMEQNTHARLERFSLERRRTRSLIQVQDTPTTTYTQMNSAENGQKLQNQVQQQQQL
eukprot:c470_g1_i1.p1 GENE.c470_g1_i1~~c470_g1_i1.p1  ORF type:complete len:280 (-),score=56.18 c470_g1_i1:270-1052(-)